MLSSCYLLVVFAICSSHVAVYRERTGREQEAIAKTTRGIYAIVLGVLYAGGQFFDQSIKSKSPENTGLLVTYISKKSSLKI
jgi:hypothetical protein